MLHLPAHELFSSLTSVSSRDVEELRYIPDVQDSGWEEPRREDFMI